MSGKRGGGPTAWTPGWPKLKERCASSRPTGTRERCAPETRQKLKAAGRNTNAGFGTDSSSGGGAVERGWERPHNLGQPADGETRRRRRCRRCRRRQCRRRQSSRKSAPGSRTRTAADRGILKQRRQSSLLRCCVRRVVRRRRGPPCRCRRTRKKRWLAAARQPQTRAVRENA